MIGHFRGATLLIVGAALPLSAQGVMTPEQIIHSEGYVKPPAVVERIVAAPRGNNITFANQSPDHKWFMKTESDALGSLTDFGKGHIYLGGIQVDTFAYRARAMTTRGGHGIVLIDPATGKTHTLETAPNAGVSAASWSPDSKSVAYIANFNTSSQIFVIDVATGKETQITTTPLAAVHVQTFEWTADGKSIVTVLVPMPRKPAPAEPAVATGPIVRLTEGAVDKERIHPSLLETPHDRDLLEYYSTGQLAVIDVKTKVVKKIGTPAMITRVNPSPDGQSFRVTLLDKPFSFLVPEANFGTEEQLWDANGKMIMEMSRTHLRAGGSGDSTAADSTAPAQPDSELSSKRNLEWNPMGPGMLFMHQDPGAGDSAAAAAGNAGRNARGGGGRGAGGGGAAGGAGRGAAGGAGGTRGGNGNAPAGPTGPDHLMVWLPPYGPNDTKLIYSSATRLNSAVYSADGKTLFVNAGNQVYAMRLADTTKHFVIRSAQLAAAGGGRGGRAGGAGGGGGRGGGGNRDTTQGTLMTKRGPMGGSVVALASDNKTVFMSGNRTPGANWETSSPRSWVDKVDIETGARSRIFDAPANEFDSFVAPVDDDYSKFIITRESPTMLSDSYLVSAAGGAPVKLTNNTDYAPEVTHAIRKRLWATRPDGFKFEVDVTLPPDYKEGTKLPGLIWFYPTEVSAQTAYDQKREATNIERFPAVGARSPEIWTTQGYVVIQPQEIPVFGPAGTMNDHYVDELRDGLYATIQVVKDAGYLDADRVGLWGHSYGAFSTVNAMVHTNWFKAGIAGDGMYNRSLTPYGFQNERRDFWQAQDVYTQMSPFYYAPQLSGALLMYHSLEDQNEGTDPISSIRMFHALLGQGKNVALFMYPYEDHGPATKESDLDQWARWIAWFDLYVKNAHSTPLNAAPAQIQPQGRGGRGGQR